MRIVIVSLLLVSFFFSGCSSEVALSSENLDSQGAAPEKSDFAQVTFSEPDGVLDCPRNLIDDSFPGRCGAFEDENGDGLCDYSQ